MPLARLLCIVALLALVPSARAEDRHGTLQFAGRERTYRLHIPDRVGAGPLPLLIALHGAGETGDYFAGETHFAAASDRVPMLAVFPDGIEAVAGHGTWNAHFCCGPAVVQNVDDVGFIGALIDAIDKQHAVDRGRVYATGMSNGGMFAYQLAAAHPEWFAAIAPVSAAIGGTMRGGAGYLISVPSEPVPVMMMHGRMDAYVLYDGGSAPSLKFPNHWKTSVADDVSFWTAADSCPTTPAVSVSGGGELTRTAYAPCKDGSAVVLWTIADGEHAWPTDISFPSASGPRNAAAEIVSFFLAHRRGE
jgi:polyhydroxybutyrate depolymerase